MEAATFGCRKIKDISTNCVCIKTEVGQMKVNVIHIDIGVIHAHRFPGSVLIFQMKPRGMQNDVRKGYVPDRSF